jgi:hypothetical protein
MQAINQIILLALLQDLQQQMTNGIKSQRINLENTFSRNWAFHNY